MMGGENTVDMRKTLLDPGGHHFLTGHAAAQEDLLRRMAAFGVGQRAQIAENTLIGIFTDGAGVHHHHIGALCFVTDLVAAFCQHAPDPLGVRFILLAAVGLHIGAGHAALSLPVGRYFIAIGQLDIQLFLRNYRGFRSHLLAP